MRISWECRRARPYEVYGQRAGYVLTGKLGEKQTNMCITDRDIQRGALPFWFAYAQRCMEKALRNA